MEGYTEEQLQNILRQYKKGLEYQRHVYHTKKKKNPIDIEKNRTRAKKYYHDNKDKKNNYYEDNKFHINCLQSYRYYKIKDRLEEFKEKHTDKYNHLLEVGYIKDS